MADMIVECPSCHTKFKLALERLREGEAKVRCSRCRHVFGIARPGVAPSAEARPQEPLEPPEQERKKSRKSLSLPRLPGRLTLPAGLRVPKLLSGIQPKPWIVAGLGGLVLLALLAFVWSIGSHEDGKRPSAKRAGFEEGDPGNERLSLLNVSGGFLDTEQMGRVFVIKGLVQNDYAFPVRHIRIEGVLHAGTDPSVLRRTAYAGNPMTQDEIRWSKWEDILAVMNAKSGRDGLNERIPEGERVPFTLVLNELPADLDEYTVRVLDSEPVNL